MAEEVLPYLAVAESFHVVFGAVDAAAGLVDAEYVDGFFGAGGEAATKVGVEAFGAEGYENIDCSIVSMSCYDETNRSLRGMREVWMWMTVQITGNSMFK